MDGCAVSAAETVDRLLRIADDEQLPWNRTDTGPVTFAPVVCSQEHQDLGLERVGVLELVDEDALKSLLEISAHLVDVAHKVARAEQ